MLFSLEKLPICPLDLLDGRFGQEAKGRGGQVFPTGLLRAKGGEAMTRSTLSSDRRAGGPKELPRWALPKGVA